MVRDHSSGHRHRGVLLPGTEKEALFKKRSPNDQTFQMADADGQYHDVHPPDAKCLPQNGAGLICPNFQDLF